MSDPFSGDTCPPAELLVAVAQGEASEQVAADLFSHLDRCVACRMSVATFARSGSAAEDAAAGPGDGYRLAGRFTIERRLGAGGMGVVYAAHDERLDIPVAVKLLRPDLALGELGFEGLRREVLLARRVRHPNVCAVHDLVASGDHAFITMERVEGRALDEAVAEDPGRALEWLRQVVDALAAAHAQGIAHGDLKPSNVMVDDQDRVRVLDFGLAADLGGASRVLEVHGGTPAYWAPEQAEGQPARPPSDIYALGRMTQQLLRIGAEPVPDPLAAWASRCCAQAVADRFGNGAEALKALDHVIADPTRRQRRRRRWRLVAALALVGLGVVATYRVVHRPGPIYAAVAVGEIDNAAEDPRFIGLDGLLERALEPSTVSAVVAQRRLRQAAQEAGHPGGAPLDTAASRRAAATLGVDLLLLPRVEQRGAGFSLTVEGVAAGEAEPSFRVVERAPDAAGVIDAVARLGRATRRALGEPAGAVDADPFDLGRAVTANLEAYAAFARGMRALGDHNSGAAARAFRRATALDEDFALAHLRYALALQWQGRHQEARQASDAALALADRLTETDRLRLLALDARSRGEIGRAQALLSRLLDRHPDDVEARFDIADLAYHAGDFPTAAAGFERVVRVAPGRQRAWEHLVWAQVASGDVEAALGAGRRWVEVHDNRSAWAELVKVHLATHRVADARRVAEAAGQRWPHYWPFAFAAALSRVFVGQADAALEVYRGWGARNRARWPLKRFGLTYLHALLGQVRAMSASFVAERPDGPSGDIKDRLHYARRVAEHAWALAENAGRTTHLGEWAAATAPPGQTVWEDLAPSHRVDPFVQAYAALACLAGAAAACALAPEVPTTRFETEAVWAAQLLAAEGRHAEAAEVLGEGTAQVEVGRRPVYWLHAAELWAAAGELTPALGLLEAIRRCRYTNPQHIIIRARALSRLSEALTRTGAVDRAREVSAELATLTARADLDFPWRATPPTD